MSARHCLYPSFPSSELPMMPMQGLHAPLMSPLSYPNHLMLQQLMMAEQDRNALFSRGRFTEIEDRNRDSRRDRPRGDVEVPADNTSQQDDGYVP